MAGIYNDEIQKLAELVDERLIDLRRREATLDLKIWSDNLANPHPITMSRIGEVERIKQEADFLSGLSLRLWDAARGSALAEAYEKSKPKLEAWKRGVRR